MMRLPAGIYRLGRLGATGLLDLLLPPACGACGSPKVAADGLCLDCSRALLSMVVLPYCPRCGTTQGPNVPIRQDGCWACPTTLNQFDSVVRLGAYHGPLRSIIRRLKYHRCEQMLRRCCELLSEAVAARLQAETLDLAMPVPMHWARKAYRGYDHARAIAHQVAKRLGLPMGDELRRIRYSPPQAQLPRTRRLELVRGAFSLRSTAAIEGAHVLLIDDVTTTGATANECTRTLLAGGASRVSLAVLAKAEPPTAYAPQLR